MSIQLHNISTTINQAQTIAAMQAAMQNEDAQAVQSGLDRKVEANAAETEVSETNQTENERIRDDESGGGAVAGGLPQQAQSEDGSDLDESPPDEEPLHEPKRGNIIDVRV